MTAPLLSTPVGKNQQVFDTPKGMKLADYRKMRVLTQGRSFQDVIKNVSTKKEIPGQNSPKAEEGTQYIVMPGDTLWDIAMRFGVSLNDLIQDNQIKNPEKLYPGQKLLIRQYNYPNEFEVVASWYGPGYHGRPMANGEIYNMYDSVVAHRDLPFGTKLEIVNPENQARVVAVVKDRGPFIKGRDIDLSYGVARRLGMVEKGVGKVLVKVLA